MTEAAFGPHLRRAYTYQELPIGATSVGVHDDVIKTGSWRTLRPTFKIKTPPCNEACPAGVDVRGFISLMKKGQFEGAYRLYTLDNPFPGICGRVCYHPCESACNRKDFDQTVGINALERYLADFPVPHGEARRPSGKRVAVVGSGPAGLSCSYYLAHLGHRITVFETLPVIGGLLKTGIPTYRLPPEVVEREAGRLQDLGVEFITNMKVNEKNWKMLETYDATLLAYGAWEHLAMSLASPAIPLGRVFSGLDLLKRVKLGGKISIGKKVVVIGGGNTAIDAARVCLRLGASVTVIYRRSKEEMPAFPGDVEDALEEGVQVLFLSSPVGAEERESGLRIQCRRNTLGEIDDTGRAAPVPVEGSDFYVEADHIISAIGEIADLSFLPEQVEITHQGIHVNAHGSTNVPGVFACGDITDQPRSVSHAIGSGKKAAVAIHCYLTKLPEQKLLSELRIGDKGNISFKRYLSGSSFGESREVIHFEDLNPAYFQYKRRYVKPKRPLDDRKGFEEIYGNFSEEMALGEGQRCFSCGFCYGCDNCYLLCPDGSVVREEGQLTPSVREDYCKGCGICANECPVGIIDMEKEE